MSHPSILVVGKVAGLSKKLDWYSQLPLFGKRVINLRALHQNEEITEKLTSLGADVIQLPLIKFKPILSEQKKISRRFLTPFTTLIFTSSNGVEFFMKSLFKKAVMYEI